MPSSDRPSGTLKHSKIRRHGADHVSGNDGREQAGNTTILGGKSPGVARIEAISNQLTTTMRWIVFLGVFLIAYAYGLDTTLRSTYQPYATASYEQHSLLATVNVLRGVIAAAAQPTAAKIADVFGRCELIAVSVFFYTLGTIVESASNSLQAFCAGTVLYQIGYTSISLLVEIVIADVTSMKTRLFFSYIPAAPFIINTWVGGNITRAVLRVTTWRWAIGMWAIIYPVCAIPLMLTLVWTGHTARKSGILYRYASPFQLLGARRLVVELFWQLDVPGIVLLIAIFSLILVPLTIAGGFQSQWSTARVIAPLVIGVTCIPVFSWWETKAKHPLVPFSLLRDRGVWAALGVVCFLNFAWYLQGDYLYTVLVVAFDFSVLSATRITSFYSFFSVIIGVLLGLVVIKIRRLKCLIVTGTCLFMVAFGLLIKYRSGADVSNRSGVIGAQILLGVAGGMFLYPTQASIQASTQHEHVAVITGLYLATYGIGSALGSCVSGVIWTQTLATKLDRNLAKIGDASLAALAYADPFTVAAEYPVGTAQRAAMIDAYQHMQQILTIVGICLCAPLLMFALLLRNPRLSDKQSQPEAERNAIANEGWPGFRKN